MNFFLGRRKGKLIMIIDNKGKIFGKINIIDLSVILIIILSLAICALKFSGFGNPASGGEHKTITYTLKAKAIRQISCDSIEIGDKIYDLETKTYIGEVVGKRQEQATEYVNSADGLLEKQVEIPTKFDLYFDVKCDAQINDKGYYLSGVKEVTNYATLNIYSNKIEVSTTVMNIKE